MGYIIRGTAMNGDIRVFASITTDIVQKAREIHDTSATASAALGRLLTAASIMGTMLKGEKDTMTVSLNGGGPAGNLVVTTNPQGNVKGYISNPHADLPKNPKNNKLNVGELVGRNGSLNVVKDLGLKEPYVGQVPISTGEIGDDIAYYFVRSEQIPTAVMLGVLVNTDLSILASGGVIIQMMPNDNSENIAFIITNRLHEIPPLSTLIAEGKTAEDILNLLFDDMDLKIYERIETEYLCDCSRERIERALLSLGREELTRLKEEDENTEVQCHFCNKKYNFTSRDIEEMLTSQ